MKIDAQLVNFPGYTSRLTPNLPPGYTGRQPYPNFPTGFPPGTGGMPFRPSSSGTLLGRVDRPFYQQPIPPWPNPDPGPLRGMGMDWRMMGSQRGWRF